MYDVVVDTGLFSCIDVGFLSSVVNACSEICECFCACEGLHLLAKLCS